MHQETMHTDSGLDTEEICPATPTGGRFSAEALSPVSPFNKRSGPEDENLRMVLVRDIGIQCCAAESPNLNSHRRSQSCENSEQAERPSSLSGKFPSELLFWQTAEYENTLNTWIFNAPILENPREALIEKVLTAKHKFSITYVSDCWISHRNFAMYDILRHKVPSEL